MHLKIIAFIIISILISAGANATEIIPDEVHAYPVNNYFINKVLPDKPIKINFLVKSKEEIPNEKVIVTREIRKDDKRIYIPEGAMQLVKSANGERVYEYDIAPLPVGDYKYWCKAIYKSSNYKAFREKFQSAMVSLINRKDELYEIELRRPIYVLVRDDEVIATTFGFKYIEQFHLLRAIIKKQQPSISEKYLYFKTIDTLARSNPSIEELEKINGEKMIKYKAIDESRPKY